MADTNPDQLPHASEDEPLTTSESSSSTLRYPQLLLETSFASLLTHSYPSEPTLSTTMEAPQRDPASLGESWASISDAELSTDDEVLSEHTDLGSLIDIHSTGDVQSIRDEDTASEAEPNEEDEPQNQQDSVVLDPVETPMNASNLEPNVLEGGKLTLDESSLDDSTVASKTLRHMSSDELRKSKLAVGEDLVLKVHMPIGKEFIKDREQTTFRIVLFCQSTASEHEEAILHKIADAQLASGPRVQRHSTSSPSRYHVIPDSLGPGSQPTAAAILPVDYQLESMHYATAKFESPTSRTILLGDPGCPKPTISEWIQDRANPSGRYAIWGSHLEEPDLAVIVVDDVGEAKNRDFARASLAFARRHNIPALAIRAHNDLISDPALAAFIADGLHLTIQDSSRSDDAILRMLPIDVDIFLSLDPSQLSRHVRHLMQRRSSSPRSRPLSLKASRKEHFDVEKNLEHEYTMKEIVEKSTGLSVNLGPWVRVLLLTLCGIMILQGLSAVKMRYNSRPKRIDGIMPSEAIIASTVSRRQPSSSAPVQVATVSKDVTVATTPASSPPVNGSLQPRKKSEVDVVGDSNIVIKTAKEYQNVETLEVHVTRDGKTLQADVRVLFPSVWSVQLEPEQAYGHVCVRLWAMWPAMDQTVAVYLGPQPSRAWKSKDIFHNTKAKVVQTLAPLQDFLGHLQSWERPQNIIKDAQARATWAMQQVDTAVQSPVWHDRASAMQETVQRHRKAYAQSLNMQASKFWNHVEELRQLRVTTRKRLPLALETFIHQLRDRFNDQNPGDRVQEIWGKVREGPQSDTLAMAQERAQYVVKGLRARPRKR